MLIKTCCDMFGVHHRDLLGTARFGFLMPARFAMYASLYRRGWSYIQIGKFMNRDRNTVRYGISRAEYDAERNAEYATRINILANLKPEQYVWDIEDETTNEEETHG